MHIHIAKTKKEIGPYSLLNDITQLPMPKKVSLRKCKYYLTSKDNCDSLAVLSYKATLC